MLLAGAALADAPAKVDLRAIKSPILLPGNDAVGYRDPLLLESGGRFHLFLTIGKKEADGRTYLYVGKSESSDLLDWTPPRTLTAKDLRLNFVSPGSVVRVGDEWILCMSTYPMPGKETFGDETARLYLMRSKDLDTWSAPELIWVKGPDVPEEKMGRMIDAYLMPDKDEQGRWWCFYKQQGASMSWSRDLKTWQYSGRVAAGENVCVFVHNGEYVMFHSPKNGVGVLRSKDLKSWRADGELITLGQKDWPWAGGRISAGYVADLRKTPGVGKYVMAFHGTGPEPEPVKFLTHGCIGIAWSDDLRHWDWPGKAKTTSKPASKPAAASVDPVTAALKQELVGPVLPVAEWQRFCDARVPRMKTFHDAAAWQAEADRLRKDVLDKVVFRGEAARWRGAKTRVEWLNTIAGGPGYRIKKLRYEALPGFWIPALLYEPEKLTGKVPVIMNVNGHERPLGKAVGYKQIRCINQAKRGILALNVEWIGMGQLNGPSYSHARMNQLDLCGTSGLAPFYLSMQRGLDLLLSLPHADPQRVAVTGVSGGGWQSITIGALDTRVTLCNPVAGYSSFRTRIEHFKDLGDSEQTPCDLATVVDYFHMTAMLAPRAALLTYNAKDNCCFESGYALPPLLDAARPIYRLLGKPDALRSHINTDPGTHNYEIDNRQAFYRAVGDYFYPGQRGFDPKEIPCDKEVKTFDELKVDLPADNQDFHTLALSLAKSLPRALPAGAPARDRLRTLVQAHAMSLQAMPLDQAVRDGLHVARWRLLVDSTWTLPAVELTKGTPQRTAVLLCDGGRAAAGPEAQRLLAAGWRVIAVDPFGIGESVVPKKEYLAPLVVAAVGQRGLGIQASQIGAVAKWAAARYPGAPVSLVACGPRAGVWALVAAALDEKAIAGLELHDALASLKDLLDKDWTVMQAPELFCFGLLESFDIPQLAALVAPRPIMPIAKAAIQQ